ncbi:MAG TPA: YibE/F family protein [Solirubrobacteraceae bacterium]
MRAPLVHTLVLAYAGAALPLLLVLQSANASLADAVNTQDIAEPIVATIVGAIALVAAVPLTTGLAGLLAVRVPAAALGDGGHAHHH